MARWAVVRVTVGAVTIVGLTLLTAVLLPFLAPGLAPAVGDSLPVWLSAVPLPACPVVGGGITGFLRAADWKVDTLLGSLAGAVGITVVGTLGAVGVSALMIVAVPTTGPTPGPETADFSTVATTFATVGAGIGFVVGAVLGAFGEASGDALRRKLKP